MGGGPLFPSELEELIKDLKSLLTPELLSLLVKARLPYRLQQSPINFSHFGRDIFLRDPIPPMICNQVWKILLTLSKIAPDSFPDLAAFLPVPTDPSFPEQCLGLLLLLDHFPRLWLRGVDTRWTYGFFSPLSQKIARKWITLPQEQRPTSWKRWNNHGRGASLDYWIAVRFWFATPFVHSENRELQDIGLKFTEETRSVVEKVSGQTDPHRADREEILSDLYGFPRVFRAGPPQSPPDGGEEEVTRESWTWWMAWLMDYHWPIIHRFGRYPYLNATLGRELAEGEEEWIEATEHFGEVEPEIARRIRQDVAAGKWTPLGESYHG